MNQTTSAASSTLETRAPAPRRAIPANARLLGYSGVVPFALCAAVLAWGSPGWVVGAQNGFVMYSAVILSFIGGIRWGAAISRGPARTAPLVFSVLPSLWAVLFLWWPDPGITVVGLMAGFVVMGIADWVRPAQGAPAWMRPLRARLTTAVVACHLAVVASF
jgi:hypothetical protein